MKLLINDKLSISKESRRLKLLGFSSLHTYFQRPDLKFTIFILWKCIWLKIYILKMLFHKEYYTIVLCYTGYWWQQTSRLLYVQSWKIHKKRSADHRRGKHFFLSFPTCLFTTLKRIRGAGGICQTDSHSHFDKILRLKFGLVWVVMLGCYE